MEAAVRALIRDGFDKDRVHIDRTIDGTPVPEGSAAVKTGAVIGAAAAVLGGVLAIATGAMAAPIGWLAFRLIGLLAAGTMTGALIGLLMSGDREAGRVRSQRVRMEWMVRIRCDEDRAGEARWLLLAHQGELQSYAKTRPRAQTLA